MSREENQATGDIQLSWWGKKQKNFQHEVTHFDLEDCKGCRFVGGGGMLAAAAYVAYVGYQRAKRSGSRYGFIPSTVVAGILGTLGLMRLGGYNPFSSSGRSTGIDALDPIKDTILKSQLESETSKKQQRMAQEKDGVEHIGQQEEVGRATQATPKG